MRRADEQTEDWVEGYLVKRCNEYRAVCLKNQRRRGWPDRTVYWWGGVTDIIETKRPKNGRYEPLQLRIHGVLRKMGHNVYTLCTRQAVDEYIAMRCEHGRKVGSPL